MHTAHLDDNLQRRCWVDNGECFPHQSPVDKWSSVEHIIQQLLPLIFLLLNGSFHKDNIISRGGTTPSMCNAFFWNMRSGLRFDMRVIGEGWRWVFDEWEWLRTVDPTDYLIIYRLGSAIRQRKDKGIGPRVMITLCVYYHAWINLQTALSAWSVRERWPCKSFWSLKRTGDAVKECVLVCLL